MNDTSQWRQRDESLETHCPEKRDGNEDRSIQVPLFIHMNKQCRNKDGT